MISFVLYDNLYTKRAGECWVRNYIPLPDLTDDQVDRTVQQLSLFANPAKDNSCFLHYAERDYAKAILLELRKLREERALAVSMSLGQTDADTIRTVESLIPDPNKRDKNTCQLLASLHTRLAKSKDKPAFRSLSLSEKRKTLDQIFGKLHGSKATNGLRITNIPNPNMSDFEYLAKATSFVKTLSGDRYRVCYVDNWIKVGVRHRSASSFYIPEAQTYTSCLLCAAFLVIKYTGETLGYEY